MTHPTDDEIMELAGAWFHTGENQKRDDGYYYRSLGTPTNVRGSDLIEFARALLQRSQPVAARFTTSLREAPHGMFAIRPGADRHVNLFRGADVLTFANASAPGDRQCKVEW